MNNTVIYERYSYFLKKETRENFRKVMRNINEGTKKKMKQTPVTHSLLSEMFSFSSKAIKILLQLK
jgi:hypothetical protein